MRILKLAKIKKTTLKYFFYGNNFKCTKELQELVVQRTSSYPSPRFT